MEKATLTIQEVKPVEKVGEKQFPKLAFRACNQTTNANDWYFTFKPKLFPFIVSGKQIDVMIDINVVGEYTNRKIVDIFQDGKSIVAKDESGGNRGNRHYTTIAALTLAVELAKTDKIKLDGIMTYAETFKQWIEK